jgi:ribose transport system substrate-binding protein
VSKPIGKPVPSGKLIDVLNCGPAGCTYASNAFKQAAAVLGWTVKIYTPAQPTPQLVQNDMSQIVNDHPAGVLVTALPAVEYQRQAAQLKAEHIPLYSLYGTDATGTNDIDLQIDGVDFDDALAQAIADKTVVDLGGKGTIGDVILSGYPIIESYTAAYNAQIKKVCPSCKIITTTIQPTSLGTTDGTDIVNFLRANPNINALFLSYEQVGEDLQSASKGAGLTLPKTYSEAPTIQGVQAALAGQRTATAPVDYNENAWQVADAFARYFTGGNPMLDLATPAPLIWSKQYNNIPAASSSTVFPTSNPSYQAEFKKLWGK